MIIDTSALVAIIRDEPERQDLSRSIHEAEFRRISVVNFVELSMVLETMAGPEAERLISSFFNSARIEVEPVTLEQGYAARQAFIDYGKGRHKARLNLGDCFAYALAKTTGEALLFKGNDFSQTDVKQAIEPS